MLVLPALNVSQLLPGRPLCRAAKLSIRATQSPSVDILLGSQRLSVLDFAEKELQELCSSRGTPEEQARCREVLQYYHDQRQQVQSGCVRELQQEGHEGPSCQTLNTLERLVYEVACTGDAEQLYHMLKIQSNMARRRDAGEPELPPCPDKQQMLDGQRSKALGLFAKMDADGNGIIDREEFLNAMTILHHSLDESEVQLVFECMDSHGHITPEQFVGIVQAETLCEPECDGQVLLRHMPHSRPAWWSDAPHYVTDV